MRRPRLSRRWWGLPAAEGGQSSVELALALPILAFLALLLLQVAFVVRDQVLVTHVAREAARAAAVDGRPGAAAAAARRSARLDGDALDVTVVERGPPGGRVIVRVTYDAPTDVPMVGPLVGRILLHAAATMRVER